MRMNKESYTTTSLMNVLKTADIADLKQFDDSFLQTGPSAFAAYMDQKLQEKGLKRQDVFQRADIPQKYGYKLLTGESHTTDRDKLLRIFFAMGLTLKEAQNGLELYGMPTLFPKIKRDAIFIIAFNRGYSSVDEINHILLDNGEESLSRCRD